MIDILLTKAAEVLIDMGYWGVFIASTGLFPSEVVVTFLSASPHANIWLIGIAASLGGAAGAIPTYLLGYILNEDILYKWLNTKGKFLRIGTKNIEESKKKIRKSGFIYAYITRLVPWLRVAASIAAGYLRVNIFQYFSAVILGTFTYTMVLAYLGLEAGHNWELIMKYIGTMDRLVIILLVASILIFLLYKSKKKVISKLKNRK